jgi:hypothetical protein
VSDVCSLSRLTGSIVSAISYSSLKVARTNLRSSIKMSVPSLKRTDFRSVISDMEVVANSRSGALVTAVAKREALKNLTTA